MTNFIIIKTFNKSKAWHFACNYDKICVVFYRIKIMYGENNMKNEKTFQINEISMIIEVSQYKL